MEIFNVISGVCSIVGLIVSLFVASKVSKMVKSNNDNKGELRCKENQVIQDEVLLEQFDWYVDGVEFYDK